MRIVSEASDMALQGSDPCHQELASSYQRDQSVLFVGNSTALAIE